MRIQASLAFLVVIHLAAQCKGIIIPASRLDGNIQSLFGRQIYGQVMLAPLESNINQHDLWQECKGTALVELTGAPPYETCSLVAASAAASPDNSSKINWSIDMQSAEASPETFICGQLMYSEDGVAPGVLRHVRPAPDGTSDVLESLAQFGFLCQLTAAVRWNCEGFEQDVVQTHMIQLDSNDNRGWFPVSHTWRRLDHADVSIGVDAAGEMQQDFATRLHNPKPNHSFRMTSFNVWNSNPPRWLWRAPVDRFRQYVFRLLHLGDVLRSAKSDIIALQEIRLDTSLGGFDAARFSKEQLMSRASYHQAVHVAAHWYNRTRVIGQHPKFHEKNSYKWREVLQSDKYTQHCATHPLEACIDAAPENHTELSLKFVDAFQRGELSFDSLQEILRKWPHSQIQHVRANLPGYQYVMKPAQLYVDAGAWFGGRHRDEEGPGIFARFPIVHHDYLLLSRDTEDSSDSHQRACLHAVVDISEEPGSSFLVDVYTVHLSLSESARERSMPEIMQFVADSARGQLQIFGGDLNAEPFERAMKELVGEATMPRTLQMIDEQFRDVWLMHHAEPVPRDPDPAVRRYALTFPSDDPTKRIDYLFAKVSHNVPANACRSDRAFLLGQDPLPGTEMLEAQGVGMVHDRSPVWASDHRALVTDITCE